MSRIKEIDFRAANGRGVSGTVRTKETSQANIFAPLVARALDAPEKEFCLFSQKGREVSYSVYETVTRACNYATHLRALGLKPGDIVLIVLPHVPDLYPSFIGCVLAGVVPSYLPPLTRKQDPVVFSQSMRALIERIEPAAAITTMESASLLGKGHCPILHPDQVDARRANLRAALQELEGTGPDQIAFLQHSSGTTGLKKGVTLTHRAVHAQANVYGKSIGLAADDRVVSWLPLYHDMGLFTSFIIPAIVGAPIVSLDAMEWVMKPTILLDAITRHRAAFSWLPNFAFQHIVRLDPCQRTWEFSSVKAIINCSEPCRVGAFARFLEAYHGHGLNASQLGVCYALAENSFAVTQTKIGVSVERGRTPMAHGFLSCGKVVEGAQVEIRHDGMTQAGGAGEIWIRSQSLFDGYFKQPELTRTKLFDGWYRTGDIGLIEEEELFVIGRTDDLLVVNGKNIFAHEIEDLVSTMEGIAPGRVLAHVAYNDEAGSSELILLAETEQSSVIDRRQLSAALRNKVFSFSGVHPNQVHLLPRGFLLKSTSGKIARAASFAKFLSGKPE